MRNFVSAVCVVVVFALAPGSACAQLQIPGLHEARGDTWMQQAHAIGVALFSYATDHDQSYPQGKSSTEIFQRLIDGGYVTDPNVFFMPMPGKVAPSGLKLKPENVCFDVTAGVDGNSPDGLPVVFTTGYKINYATDGSAVPLVKPPPPGIAVAYKEADSSKYLRATGPDGSVANVAPAGRAFQQLTPDGPLGP